MSLNLHLLKEHIDGGNIEVEFFPAESGSYKNFKGFALKIGGDVKEAFLIHESEVGGGHPLYNRFEGEINSGLAKLLTSGGVAGNELSVKAAGENIIYQQSLVTMPEALLRLKQYADEHISIQSGEGRYRDSKASSFVSDVAQQNGLDINELTEAAKKPQTQGQKTTVFVEKQNAIS